MILLLPPCASLPIVTVTGGCLPKPPRRGGWEWHPRPPPQDLSAVVPGARASCRTRCSVLHRLRFVCMVWGHCPCAFFSPSPLYRTFHVAPAPFSTPSRCPGPSRACKCVHSVALRVRVPPPRAACSPCPSSPAAGTGLHCPSSPSRADVVTCTDFSMVVLSLGGSGPLSPSSSLLLVWKPRTPERVTLCKLLPQTSPALASIFIK